ncbi:hypothetical protein JQK15_25300 [Sphingobium sp. BHU LFT2]|uniref:hypothetical protein n=1 Tax=Sphingobium sp. BHU LFT2 TaxID=2807634 RepID=UPI001BED187E|nr:hypothetical protein [Sphingobium sp. BHU LFT2]MBT2246825.1 hypothetical protein [Sphingobium sp. BHU LFT2]
MGVIVRRLFVIVLTLGLAGCASVVRINQFRQFAEIGRQQQVAVVGVVDQTITTNIDANSREILDTRDALPKAGWGELDPDEILEIQNTAVIETTHQLTAIKRHSALLDRYFQSLAALADYDGSAIATSTEATVSALTALSPRLEAMKAGDVTVPKAAAGIGQIIVNNVKAGALERELKRNADTINRELELQERLLTFLSQLIARDRDLLAQHQIMVELAEPYGDLSKPLPGSWIGTRREILIAQASAPESAAKAAELTAKMRMTFVTMCEGKASPEDLASYASDLSKLLTLVEVLESDTRKGDK